MSLTIYCLGDIPTFTAVLNGVAMVFQTGMMTGPGLGLGAAALGWACWPRWVSCCSPEGLSQCSKAAGEWVILLPSLF